jgi:hypothetical protein
MSLIGEEEGLVECDGGEAFVVEVRGGAFRIPLLANKHLNILLLIELLLLNLLPFCVLFLVIIIRTVCYKVTSLTALESYTLPF